MKQFRQGDVYLIEVNELPTDAQESTPDKRGVVLAEGEVTGHYHGMVADSVTMYKTDAIEFIVVAQPTPLTHQEHYTIDVPAGIYRVIHQREYSPVEIRRVID